jgi:hypothetical protein
MKLSQKRLPTHTVSKLTLRRMSAVPADSRHHAAHVAGALVLVRVSREELKYIINRTFFEGFPASEQEI